MATTRPIDIGTRREPFVDDTLIEKRRGVELRLHHPTPRNLVLRCTQKWEGNTCCYVTVFRDGDLFRMYYRGSQHDRLGAGKSDHQVTCCAESDDGIRWRRPELGLYEFAGSKKNNIVWTGIGHHNFSPFKDPNPNCRPAERYKAVGGGLHAFKSRDGLHWSFLRKDRIITEGRFDSQNLAFWDAVRGSYVDYHRNGKDGVRSIMTCRSDDFVHWTAPQWLDFGDAPREHLYTNAVTPMPGCEHVLVGFPKRFLPQRKRNPEDAGGVSDGVFMSSRDGLHWRRWTEAFIRPGLLRDAWFNRNNMTAWGVALTRADRGDEPELSLYVTEGYYTPRCRLRRYTLRQDGFVSVHAGGVRGEFVTRPLIFAGNRLNLNVSTSAAGSVRVELRDAQNKPLPGYTLRDAVEIYGDALNEPVAWESGPDLSALAGKPVRLRFVMNDADVYAMQFGEG